MITAAVDARMIRWSGVGTYLSHILERLAQKGSLRLLLLGDPEGLKTFPWTAKCRILPLTLPPYSLREGSALRKACEPCDVFWSPQVNAPAKPCAPLVATVHDVAPIAVPEAMPSMLRRWFWRRIFRRTAARARTILADSEFTRGEILRHAEVSAEKIRVVYPGVSPRLRPVDDAACEAIRKKHGLEGKFLLYVGNVKPHKDPTTLLEALRILHEGGKAKPQLVIAGRETGFASGVPDLDAQIASRGLEKAVRRLGEVSDDDLPLLYSAAEIVVFPSLYEGFGLPPVEALACGTPSVVSDIPVHREVLGDAAVFVAPRDAARFASEIADLLEDAESRAALVSRAAPVLRRFTPEAAADQVEETLREAAKRQEEPS